MKLSPIYRPELCASADPNRRNISMPYLDVERGKVVATSGHHLVVVPAIVELGDKATHLLPVDLDLARHGPKAEVEQHDRNAGVFPDWTMLIPKSKPFGPGLISIGLNAEYLLQIARALGTNHTQVVITFDPAPEQAMDPLLVTAHETTDPTTDAFGILMPLRLTDPSEHAKEDARRQVSRDLDAIEESAEQASRRAYLEAKHRAALEVAASAEVELEQMATATPTEVPRG